MDYLQNMLSVQTIFMILFIMYPCEALSTKLSRKFQIAQLVHNYICTAFTVQNVTYRIRFYALEAHIMYLTVVS